MKTSTDENALSLSKGSHIVTKTLNHLSDGMISKWKTKGSRAFSYKSQVTSKDWTLNWPWWWKEISCFAYLNDLKYPAEKYSQKVKEVVIIQTKMTRVGTGEMA